MLVIEGPLLLLRGFDISKVKFCSMHVCNLGLVLTANGGALLRDQQTLPGVGF